MSKGAADKAVTRTPVRTGEYGTTVPVLRRVVAHPGDSPLVELSIDLQNAPVPDRRYAADGVLVRRTEESIQVVFGQMQITDPKQLQSAVLLKLSFDATRSFLTTCVDFTPRLRQFVKSNAVYKPGALQLSVEEPNHSVVMTASMVAAVFMAREACLDFYNASPFAYRAMGKNGTHLAVDPVLRVELATGLLLSLMEQLEGLKAEIPEATKPGEGQ